MEHRRASAVVWLIALAALLVACSSAPPGATRGADRPSAPSTVPPAHTTDPTGIALHPPGRPATVIRVVDGDTLHARLDGVDEKVRIIGMDSPETSKPDTPVECFAREATAAAKRLMRHGDAIVLQADPTQHTRDRFGRLLAHVFLADGSLFAETMIRNGWAVHDIYDGVPSIHADRLAAAETAAKANQVGLWSPTTCNGNPHEPASAP